MDKDFLVLWGCITTAMSVIVVALLIYNLNELRVIEDMVANGADPIEARCAITQNNNVCLVRALTHE